MSRWSEILDRSVAGRDDAPHLRAMRLPTLDGWEPGRVWASLRVDPELLTPVTETVFGGYLATLSDHLLANAIFTVLEDDEVFSTAELHVHFFRPARAGELRVEGRVVNRGRTSAYCEVLIHDGDGRLVARAGATQAIRPAPDTG